MSVRLFLGDWRKQLNVVVSNVQPRDAPDFVDAFIAEATWKDTGIELTDKELDHLNENHPEIASELAYEDCFGG